MSEQIIVVDNDIAAGVNLLSTTRLLTKFEDYFSDEVIDSFEVVCIEEPKPLDTSCNYEMSEIWKYPKEKKTKVK